MWATHWSSVLAGSMPFTREFGDSEAGGRRGGGAGDEALRALLEGKAEAAVSAAAVGELVRRLDAIPATRDVEVAARGPGRLRPVVRGSGGVAVNAAGDVRAALLGPLKQLRLPTVPQCYEQTPRRERPGARLARGTCDGRLGSNSRIMRLLPEYGIMFRVRITPH